ncbi:MAG: ATP-binding protein [Filifactor alocis]|nr:ATP-binding protein [Filifactor alocis]
MLKQFSVKNFKGFKEKITFDLASPNNYTFHPSVISEGCITKGIIFGINGSGKSNFGLALLDIIFHLTDKEKIYSNYQLYRNLENRASAVEFEYIFQFHGMELGYRYMKEDVNTLLYEELRIDKEKVVEYDHRKKKGFTKLKGSETLNRSMVSDNIISRVKYVASNSILEQDEKNRAFVSFMRFVDNMLLFYSLDTRGYEGLQVGAQTLSEGILESGKLYDFEEFLRENDIDYKLKEVSVDGENAIHCVFGKESVDFFKIASTGTRSLALFYYWYIRMHKASFVFIDEFDAFYHFKLAQNLVKKIREIPDVQIFLSSHNTDLISNELLRPDCYFMIENNTIQPLSDKTHKELRKAHNLQKMFKAGAFDEEKSL